MKNKIKVIMAIILLGGGVEVYAQNLVHDPVTHLTIIDNHRKENNNLTAIKNNESAIAVAQATVAYKLEQLRAIEEKFEKAMRSVGQIVDGIFLVTDIVETSRSITSLTTEITRDLIDKPEYLLLAAPIISEAGERVTKLSVEMGMIVADGVAGVVWMMPADRIKALQNIYYDLRAVRAVLLTTRNKLWYAKRYGFLAAWNPRLNRQLNTLKHRRKLQDLFNQKGYGGGLNFY